MWPPPPRLPGWSVGSGHGGIAPVGNPRSTPASGVGASEAWRGFWLRTVAPPRQAGWGQTRVATNGINPAARYIRPHSARGWEGHSIYGARLSIALALGIRVAHCCLENAVAANFRA